MKKIIFLMLVALQVLLPLQAQQTHKISGKVTDLKTGEELIGVSVLIKGTTKAVITDLDGNFALDIPNAGAPVIKFSYIGYKDLELTVKDRSPLKVQLIATDKQLSEVVVVGYGTQKKESVIGSISSISNKTMVSSPVTNISQSLAGKLSGIQVVQSSGEVGSDVADVYVRGMSTWNDATPIFVVDGIVRQEYAKIDPNEIESVNILKDASATAVYGVKGANGVIIITTKRGSLGKPKVSFTAQAAITQTTNIPQPLGAYDATSLRYLADWGQYNSSRVPKVKNGTLADDLLYYRTGASPWTHPDVNWVDEIMKKQSTQQQYNVNISGGTKTIRYFISGGFINQNGFYKNDNLTKYSRFNFRSNLDVDVTKDLTASLNIGSRVETLKSPTSTIWSSWGVYHRAFAISGRDYPVYNPDGSYAGQSGGSLENGGNPVQALKDAATYKDVTSTLESSLMLNYKLDFITKGLSAKGQISFDTQGENGRYWNKSEATYVYDIYSNSYQVFGENRPLSYVGTASGHLNNWYKLYMEAGLNYSRTFGDHSVSGLFLVNRNKLTKNGEVPYADQGLVGRATYDYKKRYFGEFNAGYNGSENFPKGKRYGFFPAFALGWLISNEDFIANTSLGNIISTLKLRASLGWVGNDKSTVNNVAQRFIYLQQYNNAGGYTFGSGDNYYNGIQQGAIANENVTWEVARKENIGIETDFFKGLFGFNVDVFYEHRSNILTNIDAVKPDYVGAAFNVANIGETENKGIEIELKHNLRINKNFSYYVKGNFTYNVNKVLKKADPLGLLPYQKEEGYSIGTPLMWKNTGYFTSYEEIRNSPTQLGNNNGIPGNIEIVPGDLKFQDFNKDGVINNDDAYRQGYGTVPEIQYGITLGGTWKSFDFSVLFQGSTHALFMKNWEIMWAFSNNDNVFGKHNYYWAPETAGAAQFTRFYGKSWKNNERYYSTYEAGSGTYIRLKNVEFGYTLPTALIQKFGMSNVRVYFSSINPYMWAVEKYLDPDNRDSRGGKMPPTKAFNFGLNVNF
ncbi:TonB-dependent receptor [uncultured Bacteroides sp.]|uniref:SusC/RagA family TonB-linked outer membrane protein n=1 Tax=uncultured Bacteroides sp. TaxID=162156 RepID=UPI002AAAA4DC|nr:TonB-dependent receptor [uncultured Bacteroides sp.]